MKTPKFDTALDAILVGIQPYVRTCRITGEQFTVSASDLEMYRLLRIPPPTTSPWYRAMVRDTFSPFRLRQSFCAKSRRTFIGGYRKDSPFTIYHPDVWWSDAWDPKEYARAVAVDRPFFAQWYALFRSVPRPGSSRDPESVNSEYTTGGKGMKDCYYAASVADSEDITYGVAVLKSTSCMDIEWAEQSERCYDSTYVRECYRAIASDRATACRNIAFCFDVRNSSDCFGGFNLRNKKFVFLGEQLDEGTYRERRSAIRLGHRPTYERFRQWYEHGWREEAIHPFVQQEQCEDCVGSGVVSSSACAFIFYSIACANSQYIQRALRVRDSSDVTGALNTERAAEVSVAANATQLRFCSMIRTGNNLEYCVDCHQCEYCFGCVGLRSAKFCIFNRQYEEHDYWQVVDTLKCAMLDRGEYGEFFPAHMAPIPYEDSRASFDFRVPVGDRSRMAVWTVGDDVGTPGSTFVAPDDIREAADDILTQTLGCRSTQRAFRIVPQELAFLRREDLPLPLRHPDERMRVRHVMTGAVPMRLYERSCPRCGVRDLSDIPLNDPRKNVLCLPCYRKAVG